MKKIFLIFNLILTLNLLACKSGETINIGISFGMDTYETLTVDLVITNNFSSNIEIENHFILEYFNGTDWEFIGSSDLLFPSNIQIEPGRQFELPVDLNNFFDNSQVNKGDYRLLITSIRSNGKEITTKMEFEI